jgi:hypothetical protein
MKKQEGKQGRCDDRYTLAALSSQTECYCVGRWRVLTDSLTE